jgi:hypothetical protein
MNIFKSPVWLLLSVALILSLSVSATAGDGRDETLNLSVDGITVLAVDAGGGKLIIEGDENAREITVEASVHPADEDSDRVVLSLEKHGERAVLKAYHKNRVGISWGKSPWIDLHVRVPAQVSLDVEDGSGFVRISDINSDVTLDDGSGSVEISAIGGNVEIDDGSGSLELTDIAGDVSIEDGSGSITVRGVAGAVRVDDGSGDIDVEDAGSLVILDAGSGGVRTENIRGKLELDS